MQKYPVKTDKRKKIFEAARKRTYQYGYEKTTMAEIASDAGVSVGTLYQYFKSKEDLYLACAEECYEEIFVDIKKVYDSKTELVEKLKKIMEVKVLAVNKKMKDTPHGGDFFGSLRPKIIELKEKYEFMEQELIKELLIKGNKKGIFRLDDPKIASKSFHLAFSKFLPPLSFQSPEEELMEGVKNMTNILLNGLLVRGGR